MSPCAVCLIASLNFTPVVSISLTYSFRPMTMATLSDPNRCDATCVLLHQSQCHLSPNLQIVYLQCAFGFPSPEPDGHTASTSASVVCLVLCSSTLVSLSLVFLSPSSTHFTCAASPITFHYVICIVHLQVPLCLLWFRCLLASTRLCSLVLQCPLSPLAPVPVGKCVLVALKDCQGRTQTHIHTQRQTLHWLT